MRKNLMMVIVVAAAALLAACSDTTKLNNKEFQPTTNDLIGFSTYTEKATRAADANSTNLFDFYKTFDVYAWKSVGTDVQNVFGHVPVEYFTADAQGDIVYATAPAKPSDEWGENWATDTRFKGWFYEEIRYWDKLATGYNFYAIAPYEVTPSPALTIANGDANIKIGSATDRYDISTEKNLAYRNDSLVNERRYFGFNKDYMLADKWDTKNQLVSFQFHHILTKLNVMITLADSYIGSQAFTIKKLDIVGLEKEANFEYAGMTTNGWTTEANSTYDIKIDRDYILKNVPENAPDTTEYSGYYWIQTLIFPQTLTCAITGAQRNAPDSKYLYIEYTIGGETFKAYYDLAYVFDNNITATGTYDLEQGSEYTINIKVGPEPIVFDAKATKWAEVDEIDHIIN